MENTEIELREAVQQLVERLSEVDTASAGIFQYAAIHGMPYTGPTWEEPLKAVKALLATES